MYKQAWIDETLTAHWKEEEKTMKRLAALVLMLVLACAALCAAAEEEWTDFTCKEEQFTTKIPVSALTSYRDERGLVGMTTYLDVPGYPPFVMVHRRAMDKKFKDPVGYLNNVYREFLENKYQEDSMGMNPAKKWEIGGKELIGARYMFRSGDQEIIQLQLIEVREQGDVEYTAMYTKDSEEAVMKVLNTEVRYYQEGTKPAAVKEPAAKEPATEPATKEPAKEPAAEPTTKEPAAGGGILLPVDHTGEEADLRNGIYRVHITDIEHINDGGCFTIELYAPMDYPAAAVEALKPGDKVEIFHRNWTVAALEPQEDGELRVIPEEEFSGYMAFKKDESGNYISRIGDWYPVYFMTDANVMLPFPNDFNFVWVKKDNAMQEYNADGFIKILNKGTLTEKDLSPYNTVVTIRDGMVYGVVHSEYPVGPDEY